MGDRLGIHGAAGLFWPFLAMDFFCRHMQQNLPSFWTFWAKKIFGPRGDSNRLSWDEETNALSTRPHRLKVLPVFFAPWLFCRHPQKYLDGWPPGNTWCCRPFLAFFGQNFFFADTCNKICHHFGRFEQKKILAPGGTWTGYLWIRRPTPYPLGHTGWKFCRLSLPLDSFADTHKSVYHHFWHFEHP